jgi:ABC-type transport system substrate-binding protein
MLVEELTERIRDPIELRVHPGFREVYAINVVDADTFIVRSRTSRALMLDDFADITLMRRKGGGLGAFSVAHQDDNRVLFEAVAGHFAGPSGIQKVEFVSFRSQRAAWAALMRGEVDALHEVTREAVEFVEKQVDQRVYPFLRPYVSGLLFNVERPTFRDPSIRRALAAAIDRDRIVSRAYHGRGVVAEGPLWPRHWAIATDAARQRQDVERADGILSKLQLSNAGTKAGPPSRLSFRCLIPPIETQPQERIALMLQRQLYERGVDMQLEPVTLPQMQQRMNSGDFDAVLIEFLGRTPAWLYAFWHSPSATTPAFLRNGYSAADAALESLQSAQTDGQVRDAITRVYQVLYDDPPAIFIAWPEVSRAVSTDFEVLAPLESDIMGTNLRLWRPARDQASTP